MTAESGIAVGAVYYRPVWNFEAETKRSSPATPSCARSAATPGRFPTEECPGAHQSSSPKVRERDRWRRPNPVPLLLRNPSSLRTPAQRMQIYRDAIRTGPAPGAAKAVVQAQFGDRRCGLPAER